MGQVSSSLARRFGPTTFAGLGAPSSNNVRYCSDCTATSPCAGSGTGAYAYRSGGAWNCGNGASGTGTVTSTGTTGNIATFTSSTNIGNATTTGTGNVVLATTPTFTTSIKTPAITVPSDSTTALTYFKANGSTAVGVWDTTNTRLRIGSGVAPTATLDVTGAIQGSSSIAMGNGSALYLGQSGQRSALYSSADSQVFATNGTLTGLSFLTLGPTAPTISDGSVPANAQGLAIVQKSELLTIAAAATSTTTMTIPAGAIVISVNVRVTVVIPTAATFTVIGNTTTTVFNTAAVAVAAGTTDAGTAAGAFYNSASQTIRITPNLTPGDNSGRVRITIVYLSVQPATS